MTDTEEYINSIIREGEYKLTASNLSDREAIKNVVKVLNKITKESTRVISLIGGPASGKTIFAKSLAAKLGSADYISTDDHVVGDREYRRKNLGGYNYSGQLKKR